MLGAAAMFNIVVFYCAFNEKILSLQLLGIALMLLAILFLSLETVSIVNIEPEVLDDEELYT